MPVKRHKPTSPGRRFATWADNPELTKKEPERNLTEGLKKSGGRNTHGRITSRHRGGGAKRLYRRGDFKRTQGGGPPPGAGVGDDPHPPAPIAPLHPFDGGKRANLPPARARAGGGGGGGGGARPPRGK